MPADLKSSSLVFFIDLYRRGLEQIEQQLFDPRVVCHFPTIPDPLDLADFRQVVQAYMTAFPDGKFSILSQVAEGTIVVTHLRFEGTHTGELVGIPATGRRVRCQGVTIDRYNPAGKVVERWDYFDQLAMLVQMGIAPIPIME